MVQITEFLLCVVWIYFLQFNSVFIVYHLVAICSFSLCKQEQREKEKKEREKQKKKERIERQKKEGTFLTAKEKEAKRVALAKLEAMKAQGMHIWCCCIKT